MRTAQGLTVAPSAATGNAVVIIFGNMGNGSAVLTIYELHRPGLMPESFGMVSHGFGMIPHGFGMIPQGFGMVPQGFGMIPQGFGMVP